MPRLWLLLDNYWLAALLLLTGAALGYWQWRRRTPGESWLFGPIVTSAIACFGLGGLALPQEVGMWLAAGAAAALFLAFLVTLIGSNWSYYVGLALGALLALGLGGLTAVLAAQGLNYVFRVLVGSEIGVSSWQALWFFVPAMLAQVLLFAAILLRYLRSADKSPTSFRTMLELLALQVTAWAIAVGFCVVALRRPETWLNQKLGWFSAIWLWLSISLLIVWISSRSLAALGPIRRIIAIGLRCLLVLFLILALAELRLRKPSESLTVIFVVDRSLSIPADIRPDDPKAEDQRWKRIQSFIANAIRERGTGHELDQAGVIVFGRRPRLILPPSTADIKNISDELAGNLDPNYTDLGAAIKLALASFPEASSKRIVLLSDGNENLGNAEEQARLAKLNNIQIDTVTLAAGYRNEEEVLVQSVEAPPLTEQGSRLPIRVLIRSYNPRLVRGILQLRQKSTDSAPVLIPINPGPGVAEHQVGKLAPLVILRPGLNSFNFKQTLGNEKRSYTYEAVFQPLAQANEAGQWVNGVPGDRPQNNSASTHVVTLGQRRVLFIEQEGKAGQEQWLISQLPRAGKSKMQIVPITPKDLPATKAEMGVFLSNFDSVVLANVPAEQITNDQMEMIRTNTYDQGCGLVMIGGPDSFGAGGWQDTAVEKALPVDCDIKSLKVAGKGGLVLIFHASEIKEGNRLQKEVAKLAVRKLSPVDMLGVVYWDFGTKWHVKFQTVGLNRESMLRQIDKMTPNDMPDCNPSLQLAFDELTKPAHGLATKHIIFISDGDHWTADKTLLAKMKSAGITCTTVCITNHGVLEYQKMKEMAVATGGRFYPQKAEKPLTAANLPAIYIQETRIVAQSFISEKKFTPALRQASGPAASLPDNLPPLYGFVRTTRKPSALSMMPIEGPSVGDQEYPVLAYWQYGLGKAVAFTSDARTQAAGVQGWDREWASSDIYLKFWEQVIGWTLRSVETGRLAMVTEYRDGKIHVTIDARDENKKPITNLRLEGRVTPPNPQANGGKDIILEFKQKNAGQYEAEFKAEEAGSYFLNAQAKQAVTEKDKSGKDISIEKTIDGVRSGVTIPYSPEFADLESNTALLKKIAEITGGEVWNETDADLKRVINSNAVFRPAPANARSLQPFWFWLVLLAGVGLLLDVAIRRIAVEPEEAFSTFHFWWESLRGRREALERTPAFIERLRQRKGEAIDERKTRRRFEAEVGEGAAAPQGADTMPEVKPATPTRPTAPEPTGDDYAARLLRAKRKAMGERDKDKQE
ncbi:MAG TPA: VWA domain-containing protein [Gemmataceae bacterium]|nr:VWA domain-containing protein [Gemmataceae bacterium]